MTEEEAKKRLDEITGNKVMNWTPEPSLEEGAELSREKWNIIAEHPALALEYGSTFCGLCSALQHDCTKCPLKSCTFGESSVADVEEVAEDEEMSLDDVKDAIRAWIDRMEKELKEWEESRGGMS